MLLTSFGPYVFFQAVPFVHIKNYYTVLCRLRLNSGKHFLFGEVIICLCRTWGRPFTSAEQSMMIAFASGIAVLGITLMTSRTSNNKLRFLARVQSHMVTEDRRWSVGTDSSAEKNPAWKKSCKSYCLL